MEAQLSREDESPKGRSQQSSEAAGFRHGRQHGLDRFEGSPSLRGCGGGGGESEAPTEVNDQPQADDADSHQVLLFFLGWPNLLPPVEHLQKGLLASFPLLEANSAASSGCPFPFVFEGEGQRGRQCTHK